ncbi:trypsin-like peptidase domain-containing protein, partial [Anaerolinea sp.]|uniref:nSTAND1 domain-containing NTPase n=1 Tax=Anaerolinea sp. TaxID=1872519 RepID=UPI002ACD43F7
MSDTIEYSLVRVFHSTEREKIIGTGFFVGGNWCLTCNHVVRDAGWTAENPIHVWVDFPFLHSPRLKGIVKPTDFPGEYDLALLELEDELPREARPIRLVDSSNVFKHPFRTYGFPHKRESGVWAHGILIAHNIEDFLQIEHTEEKGYFLQRGFSGAPVWDNEENACVGMVVQRDPDTEVAFALSVKGFLKCLPELRNQTLPSNPYRGLKPFREEDAPYFFGRDDYTKRLLRAVEGRTPLTTVLGASGSGKSSLVFAGLLPRLRIHPEWVILSMTPGEDPFSALARACLPFLEPEISETDRLREINKLSSALSKGEISFSQVVERIQEKHHKDHLLLFIDQFEQLYKPVLSRETIQKFHASVFHPLTSTNDPRWQVVLTLRSEFLEEATRDEIFEKLLNQGEKIFLGAMGRDNLIQAAEAPARKQGVDFEDGLVKRIIDDLEEGSGALPLLEFTLSRLWEEQQNYRLTHQAYENVGKVAGALEAYAESVFSRLSDQERDLARQIFLQLVHLEKKGDKDVFTSRRAWRSELSGERWEVVRKLADTRLLITDHDSAKNNEFFELIHESLLTYWQTLKGWIEENSSFIAWLETARKHREEWERTGQDPNALLKGALLSEALKWMESGAGEIEEPVRKYIEESHKAWMREQQTRKRRERMVRQWLAGMALIFLVLAGWAWRERASALAQRNLALANQLAAQAQQLNANIQNPSDQVLAPLLAIESLRLHDSPEARSVLHQTLFKRSPISHILRHKGPLNAIAFSPDGKYFATGSWDGSAVLVETASARELARIQHDGYVEDIAFSPDGKYFATRSRDGSAVLVETASARQLARIQ